jgi:hypothetical protein
MNVLRRGLILRENYNIVFEISHIVYFIQYVSFVGYFPADKPLYSCIVVIYEPSTGVYGGIVAAPVFKEIAEKTGLQTDSIYKTLHEGIKKLKGIL